VLFSDGISSTSDGHNSAVMYSVAGSDRHKSAVMYSVAGSDGHKSAVTYSVGSPGSEAVR
jgi:hypothetical protein